MNMLRIFTLLLLFPATTYLAVAESASDAVESGDPGAVTKTLVWPDGTRYVGGVVGGKRSGKGTIFWQDGTRFVGQFENDMRNGPGTMILPDGTVYTGFFKDDELVDTESTIAASNTESMAMDAEDTLDALDNASLPMEADSLGDTEAPEPAEVAQVDEYDTLERTTSDDYENIVEEPVVEEPIVEESIAEEAATAEVDEYPYSSDVTEITEVVKEELIEAVDLWAAAWSDQNVPQYLANYSDDFSVPGRQSRRTWEALRRTRITRPSYIKLDIEYQRFELVEAIVVDVFFRQTYSSNTYSDLTDKVLRLRREDDTNWKILVERSR